DKGAVVTHLHLNYGVGARLDQLARADVAAELFDRAEMAPADQHRIAAASSLHRHDDVLSLLRCEAGDEVGDEGRADLRHVAEADERAFDPIAEAADSGLERRAESLREAPIVHEPHR